MITISAQAQISFYREPISYENVEPKNAVSAFQERIAAGQAKLDFEDAHGYLKSVLQELNVPVSSQVLVFSKTSLQLRRISPYSPRALYFNDDTYVGWVPYGDVVEVTSVDPQNGPYFYTLSQDKEDAAVFLKDQGNCLTCHASSRTQGVPGHLVRSVYPSPSGQPNFGAGTFNTNQTSPFEERWGGWYVTGTHGKQRHMGNVVAKERDRPELLDIEDGANVTDLSDRAGISRYLSPHSDIVSLMVLEHQTDMHNYITRANFETRLALHQSYEMNKALDRPEGFVSDSAKRRIAYASDKLVDYMLFVDEAKLTDKVKGTSKFAEEFAARGPNDSKGRSLRQFDLETRMFKYPCSYLIYSDAFQALPPEAKSYVHRRLWEILKGENKDDADAEKFAHLSDKDRQSIYQILCDTCSDLPEYWITKS